MGYTGHGRRISRVAGSKRHGISRILVIFMSVMAYRHCKDNGAGRTSWGLAGNGLGTHGNRWSAQLIGRMGTAKPGLDVCMLNR